MSLHSSLRALRLSAATAAAGVVALGAVIPVSSSATVSPSPAPAPSSLAAPSAPAAPAAPLTAAPPVRARALPAPLPAAPVGEVLRAQRAAGLDCALTGNAVPLCVHGADRAPAHLEVAGSASGTTGTTGRLGCYGDGTSGPRVRALYARPQSAPDRYSATVPSIRSWAAGVSGAFDASAARTGGRRHVRFATTPGKSCSLVVQNVVLPDAAFASFRGTIDALEARGFDAASSKYLVWADAKGYCGIATTYADDRPGLDNLNNSSLPAYARIDRGCWGKVETHEVVHMLGGIQPSARNATAGFHCSDGFDVMCYADGTAGSKQRAVCGKEHARLLDCRNDDYFSTAAAKGSYLQTHWNTARSSFLSAKLDEPAPAPAATATSSPKPKPKPSPSPSRPSSTSPLPPVVLPTLAPTVAPPVVVPIVVPTPAPLAVGIGS